jgi:hypothetical protein
VPEPTSPETGLDLEPSLVLNIDTSSPGALATSLEATLGKLIDDAKSAHVVAPLAAAIGDFAKLAPNGQEPVAGGQCGAGCANGSLTASGATYSLSNCELNGHVASGTAVMIVSG